MTTPSHLITISLSPAAQKRHSICSSLPAKIAGIAFTVFSFLTMSLKFTMKTATLADKICAYQNGSDPLTLAVSSGNFECCKFLLQQPNIDVNKVQSNGSTLLEEACRRGDERIARLLLDAGANPNSAVSEAAAYPNLLALLIQRGAKADVKTKGFFPIQWAAAFKNPDSVHLLIDAKADLSVLHKSSSTLEIEEEGRQD